MNDRHHELATEFLRIEKGIDEPTDEQIESIDLDEYEAWLKQREDD